MSEIVKTWSEVTEHGDLYLEGQRPDNGDWMVVQVLRGGVVLVLIPVLDETGTPRIRVIREPDNEA